MEYEQEMLEAVKQGDVARVGELLEANPAFFGHEAVVDLLLDKGADPAIASNNAMRVMPIHAAVATQQLDIARTLLARGSPVNAVQADDFTPLHAAAQNGQLEMVKLLIEHGADVNARKADGQTALELAIQHSHPEVAEVLRWRGAAEKMITGGVFLPATATPQKDRSHRRHGELRRIQPG